MDKGRCFGLLRRRECLVPTGRGWVVFLAAGVVLGTLAVRLANPFFSVNRPVPARLLVVEGWAPDYALEFARREFERGGYERLLVAGGPMERGIPLSEYGTYAELGAATLLKLGLTTNLVRAVPAPRVPQDRTYTGAVAIRRWLEINGGVPETLNVVSVGAHARRSRLMFSKALGGRVRVGILNVASEDFDPDRWWTSSPGVRSVLGEAIAYGYARVLFRPANPAAAP
jgi:hypothetical protein